MKDDYDQVGQAYVQLVGSGPVLPLRRRLLGELAGPAAGRSVLDLGCGNGCYGRQLLGEGAASALGVDLSAGMLAQARRLSAEACDSMQFEQADLLDWACSRSFDITLAIWVFCVASDYATLARLYAAAARVTRADGRFIAAFNRPDYEPTPDDGDYGVRMLRLAPECGVRRLQAVFGGAADSTQLVDYQWDVASHERAARAAGFTQLEWHVLRANAVEQAAAPSGFWGAYNANPLEAFLLCRR